MEAGVSRIHWLWGMRAVAHWRWMGKDENEAAFSLVDGTVLAVVMSGVVLGPVFWAMRWSSTARHRLVLGVVDAIVVGGKARAAPRGRGGSRALRQLDQRCRHVEKRLFKCTASRVRSRGAPPVSGDQRVALHQVDVDPEPALTELARLQLVIAENHLYGRQAALLPAELLQDVRPVSRLRNTWRESAHVATAILAAMTAAAGAARALPSMGVGEDVRPWLILGAAVLAATLVAGWPAGVGSPASSDCSLPDVEPLGSALPR
ncbi:hypothetical protein JHN63_25195 [Streptomyces sp. MBT65]|uniref:hypothetical protein n=1 Tax=Streptomyces sp. MBT65 TaxID=1488395 RepID=UPI00190A0120|nr:hypothetical protein [Streptomyces sp. MBT65]MBK3577037.1 hypothetical protein [Streptomyces sp. MBT65]